MGKIKEELKPDESKSKVKTPKKKSTRYFDVEVNESQVEKIPLKKPKKNTSSSEVIEVSMNEKPFGKAYKRLRNKSKGPKKPDVDPELIKKHSRGEQVDESGVKTNYFKEKIKRKEIYLEYATEQAALTELLLREDQGFIEPGEDRRTIDLSQKEIVKNVDITAATKHFNLNLDFGPYHHCYTKNGRHLLLGGRMGHVAAFDWVTKKLHCEMNVMEEIQDVSWLHIETMFACAQKDWVYLYDNQGVEIHCIKRLYRVNKLEFLPYHFLLATGNTEGYLSWLDVSIGEIVGHYNSKLGNIRVMRHNPGNGVICVGSGNGVVSLWSPKLREPLAKMLCHRAPISALAIDPKGNDLVTGSLDSKVKVWDIRKLDGPKTEYSRKIPVNHIDISQKGVLAFSMGKMVEMYLNEFPYLKQRTSDFIHCLRFCPFEDVLGVSTEKGFTSLLVPGSGEPNYDALEANPMQTKKQRREHEVHALLEKIPAELITLDSSEIAGVDVETLQEKVENKKNILFVKPPQIDFKSRHKMKGKGGSVKAAKNKQIVRDTARKEFVKEIKKAKSNIIKTHKVQESEDFIPLENTSVLDRFKPKKKKK